MVSSCILSADDDRRLIREAGAGIAHCPNSNFALFSGTFDVRRALSDGLNVGLGTDVAGGSSPSMLDAIRQAPNLKPISLVTQFFVAFLRLLLRLLHWRLSTGRWTLILNCTSQSLQQRHFSLPLLAVLRCD